MSFDENDHSRAARASRRAQRMAEIESTERRIFANREARREKALRKGPNFARKLTPLTEEEQVQYELPPLELIPGATHPDFPILAAMPATKISKKGNKRGAYPSTDAERNLRRMALAIDSQANLKARKDRARQLAVLEDVEEMAYPKRKLPGAMRAKVFRVGSLADALNEPVKLYLEGQLPGGDRTLGKAIAKSVSIRRKEGGDRAALAAEAKSFMERAKLQARAYRIAYNKLKRKQISPEQRLRNAQRARAKRARVSTGRELPFAGMDIE